MTDDERKKRNGFRPEGTESKNVKKIKPSKNVRGTTPASYNVTSWMGPIKNQLSCGRRRFPVNIQTLC